MVVCGLLCKEQGITAVIVCAAYDIVVAARVDLRSLLGVCKEHIYMNVLQSVAIELRAQIRIF